MSLARGQGIVDLGLTADLGQGVEQVLGQGQSLDQGQGQYRLCHLSVQPTQMTLKRGVERLDQ